jgi:hypothetical protein
MRFLSPDFVEFIECCDRHDIREDCWANRVVLDLGGVHAGFISLPDLIANKRAAGRPQDLVDADVLEEHGDL